MKVIKKINNNVAVCLDSNNCELVAFGKGIGFKKIPYELTDLSVIDRTFYDLSPSMLALFNEIPENVFQVSMEITDKARNYLHCAIPDTFAFTLADHLNFTIERMKKNLIIENLLSYEVRSFYEKEMNLAKWARRLIYRRMAVKLPEEEETSLALHFINIQNSVRKNDEEADKKRIIEDITDIVEDNLELMIDQKDFNYSRFIMHLQYLLKRLDKKMEMNTDNLHLFEKLKSDCPDVYQCTLQIQKYFNEMLNLKLSDEELLYLMIHINRFRQREGL